MNLRDGISESVLPVRGCYRGDPMKPLRISRKKFILGAAATAFAGIGAREAAASALSYPEDAPGRRFRFASLDEALSEIRRLAQAGHVRTTGAWSWPQILIHNAQGIEYSLQGYPESKPPLIRRTVGRWVHGRFAEQGYMKHDLTAAIPGAPPLPGGEVSQEAALARLERAVSAFHSHEGPLAPHFVYDALEKSAYDRVHAMHLANHLSELA